MTGLPKKISTIYPRHDIDISQSYIYRCVLSYCFPIKKAALEKQIITHWKKPYVKISFTVRTALDAILTSLHLTAGSEVLMSAINIPDMAAIVTDHNLSVIAVTFNAADFTITPENLMNLITKNTKVIIIAQLYGVINNLKKIHQLCKQYNIILIEDCAQAFCGANYYGSQYADFSLFSFGVIKSSTALGAAIVVTRTQQQLDKINLIENNYPIKSEFWFFKRLIKYSVLKLLSSATLYTVFIKMLMLLRYDINTTMSKIAKSFNATNLISQIRFKAPLHLLYLLNLRLQTNNHDSFKNREIHSRQFIQKLNHHYEIPGYSAQFNSFWLIPILTENPEHLQKTLLQHGFDSTLGKHSQIAINNNHFAQSLLNKMLYLPNIINMDNSIRKKLLSVLLAT